MKFLPFLLITLLPACEKEDLGNNALNGRWKWVSTDGGIAFHIHDTPASTGKTVEMIFNPNRSYQIYTNDTLASAGTFSLTDKQCIHDHTFKPVIHFSSGSSFFPDMMIEKIENGALRLSDENYDGIESLYQRIPR